MEAQDDKLAEVEPAVLVVAESVVNHPIDNSAEVQLMAKGVELNLEVDGLGGQYSLVDMKGLSMLVGLHTCLDDRVQIDGGVADIDWYEHARGKQKTELVAFNGGLAIVPQKCPFTRAEGFGETADAWFLGRIQKFGVSR
jgi:hypothetical protein